ncbi:hypothetical protein GCM10027074_75390 [Streptomyces deserti]
MAKAPTVIGVLTEPPAPTWWKTNRHRCFLAAGVLLGYLIGTHTGGAPTQQPDTPRPGHTAPATPGQHRTTLGIAA